MRILSMLAFLSFILCTSSIFALHPVFVDDACIFPVGDFGCLEVMPLSSRGYSIDYSHHDELGIFFIGENICKFNDGVISKLALEQKYKEQMGIYSTCIYGPEDVVSLWHDQDYRGDFCTLFGCLYNKSINYDQYINIARLFGKDHSIAGLFIGKIIWPASRNKIISQILEKNDPLSDELRILWLRISKHTIDKKLALSWVQRMEDPAKKKLALNHLPEGLLSAHDDVTKTDFLNRLEQCSSNDFDNFIAECQVVQKEKRKKSKSNLILEKFRQAFHHKKRPQGGALER